MQERSNNMTSERKPDETQHAQDQQQLERVKALLRSHGFKPIETSSPVEQDTRLSQLKSLLLKLGLDEINIPDPARSFDPYIGGRVVFGSRQLIGQKPPEGEGIQTVISLLGKDFTEYLSQAQKLGYGFDMTRPDYGSFGEMDRAGVVHRSCGHVRYGELRNIEIGIYKQQFLNQWELMTNYARRFGEVNEEEGIIPGERLRKIHLANPTT